MPKSVSPKFLLLLFCLNLSSNAFGTTDLRNVSTIISNETKQMASLPYICQSCFAGGINGFTTEPDCYYPVAGKLHTQTTTSWQLCSMNCEPYPTCNAWTWDLRASKCTLWSYTIGEPVCHSFRPHESYSGRRCSKVPECKVDYSCDFSKGTCQWTNDDKGADFQWTTHQGLYHFQVNFSSESFTF